MRYCRVKLDDELLSAKVGLENPVKECGCLCVCGRGQHNQFTKVRGQAIIYYTFSRGAGF